MSNCCEDRGRIVSSAFYESGWKIALAPSPVHMSVSLESVKMSRALLGNFSGLLQFFADVTAASM